MCIRDSYWQNAADQSLYICAGKDFSKLPMRSNGAPYPLEAMVIDTSQNPGRRVIRMGYIEAVGAVMWFSPLFWDRVGQARKDRIVSSDWTNPAEIGSGSMRIQISECSFNSTDTGDAQNQLRAMIFG